METLWGCKQELDQVKSHNIHLMEQAEADKLKLQETEGSMKELEEVSYEQNTLYVLPLMYVDH